MTITFLSGGTGTPKLIRGFRRIMDDGDLSVVVNTGEDMWLSGNHLSPDIDTVMFLFAGILNTETWWGIEGDTFHTHEFAKTLGDDEYIAVGDRDRAVHIVRAEMLRGGMTLTEATSALSRRLGVEATILPMTDTEVTTYISTGDEIMHFQEYWVKHRGRVEINEVIRRYEHPPRATREVCSALEGSDAIVIGPSNPITSISPILECEGIGEILQRRPVIVVSPFIGDRPVSGPAAALMEACGYAASSRGTFALYEDFADIFIQDIRDVEEIEGALRFDTLMVDEEKARALAEFICTCIESSCR
jgi:LPPG:FO 2-phospho-L-lactate transferase